MLCTTIMSLVLADLDTVAPTNQLCSGITEPLGLLTFLPKRDSATDCTSSWTCGLAISPALDLAVEQINNSSNILPCHKLELLYRETGCEAIAEAVVGLTSGLFYEHGSTIVGGLGPMCYQDSKVISSITSRTDYQLVVLHNAALPFISDHTRLPNSLSILGSSHALVSLSQLLLKESGWHNIAILFESDHLFYNLLKREFISSLDNQINMRYVSTVSSNFYPLRDLWRSKARIVFVYASLKHARNILCLAYHMGLVYPGYQWVFVGHYFSELTENHVLVDHHGIRFSCTTTQLSTVALNRALLLSYQLSTDSRDSLQPTNLTLNDFLSLYRKRVDDYNMKYHKDHLLATQWAHSMYDAVWAWAVVLDSVLSNVTITNFHVYNGTYLDLGKAILNKFYSIDFQGVSGYINFNSMSGSISRRTNMYLVVDGREKHIAYNNGTEAKLLGEFETVPDLVKVVNLPHKGIVGIFLAIQSLIFFLVVVLHAVTFLHRNSKHIKASSPKLIHVAFLGEYIFILTMFLYTTSRAKVYSSSEGAILCRVLWTWLLPLTFTLKMGIIILRTWRLYRIFKHYLNPGKLISNPALLTILLLMLLIDIIFSTIWTLAEPLQFGFSEYEDKDNPTNELLIEQGCKSEYFFLWVGLAFTYKIFLLKVMAVLACLTHSIRNQTFSTSALRIFTYIFSAVFIIGFSYYYFLLSFADSSNHEDFICLCVLFIILAIIFLVFVVIPPIYPLLQNVVKSKMKTCFN